MPHRHLPNENPQKYQKTGKKSRQPINNNNNIIEDFVPVSRQLFEAEFKKHKFSHVATNEQANNLIENIMEMDIADRIVLLTHCIKNGWLDSVEKLIEQPHSYKCCRHSLIVNALKNNLTEMAIFLFDKIRDFQARKLININQLGESNVLISAFAHNALIFMDHAISKNCSFFNKLDRYTLYCFYSNLGKITINTEKHAIAIKKLFAYKPIQTLFMLEKKQADQELFKEFLNKYSKKTPTEREHYYSESFLNTELYEPNTICGQFIGAIHSCNINRILLKINITPSAILANVYRNKQFLSDYQDLQMKVTQLSVRTTPAHNKLLFYLQNSMQEIESDLYIQGAKNAEEYEITKTLWKVGFFQGVIKINNEKPSCNQKQDAEIQP